MKFREYKVMCFSKCWKKKAWLEKAGFLCNRTRREKEYMCRQHAHASCRTDLRISQLCQQDNRTQAMLTKVHLFPDCGCGKGKSRRETLRGLPSVRSDWGVHISFNLLPSWSEADYGIRAGNGLMLLWNSKEGGNHHLDPDKAYTRRTSLDKSEFST